ncbi:MAG: hypothetical protein ACFFCS_26055 [Candidatus Hodarchaeota archaeon]
MAEDTERVEIRCPGCDKRSIIEIPKFLVKESQEGVLKVQIPQGVCCEKHSFLVYIDKKFKVRGYQSVDIEFILDQQVVKDEYQTEKDAFCLNDLIEIIGADIMGLVLRTILVKKPILFLDEFDLNNRLGQVLAFMKDMESEDLVLTARKIKRDELKEKNIRKANPLVVVPFYKAIMWSPFIDNVNTSFEKRLLEETLAIPDRNGEIIFLRRELVKISEIIEKFTKYLNNIDQIYDEDIPELIAEKFNYTLNAKQANVLKEVIDFTKSAKLVQKIRSKLVDVLL